MQDKSSSGELLIPPDFSYARNYTGDCNFFWDFHLMVVITCFKASTTSFNAISPNKRTCRENDVDQFYVSTIAFKYT